MQRYLYPHLLLAALGLCALLWSATTWAGTPVKRSLCVYDPVGANGFVVQQFQNYLIEARAWGVNLDIKAYSDGATAASDFRAGHCDAVGLTGIRTKDFVDFAGSLDMVGALQTYYQLHTAIQVISSPKAAELMRAGNYEVAGVVPGGKVFLFARDKHLLSSLEAAAGHEVAVIGFDRQAKVVAQVAGTSPVPATIASFGPMFNNHSVDMAYAPSFAYNALELYKGLGADGGVADFVLGMLSLQLVIHRDRFPDGYGQNSRSWVAAHTWKPVIRRIREADAGIPDHYWVRINGERETKYRGMLREIRERLWNQGWYNHRMQHLLKKIRCKDDPSRAECSQPSEGSAIN